MKIPQELAPIARRIVWDEPVAYTLEHPDVFLTRLMVHGTLEDIVAVKRHFNDDAFRDAIRNAPPGLFDPRSWSYWHVVLRMEPPPLPSRRIGDMELPYESFPPTRHT